MSLRILVASAFEAGSPLAHAINTVKMAEGFARLGHRVTLACRSPAGGAHAPHDLARLYALKAPLDWVQVRPTLGQRVLDAHAHFATQILPTLLRSRPQLVFSRSYLAPWLSSRLGFPTVAESHAHPGNISPPFLRFIRGTRRRSFRLLVTISDVLVENFRTLGVPAEKIAVLPDAADVASLTPPDPLPPSPYPQGRRVAAYVGHLYDYKGIPSVIEAAALLPEVAFHLVGGLQDDISRHKRRIAEMRLENVTLHGLKPHSEIGRYLWHADVLLLPPSARHPSAQWTSPVKLGEYLASGTPTVTTAIPALLRWLDAGETCFVAPDDPTSLADGIRRVLNDPAYATALSAAGRRKAASLSYERRAQQILDRVDRAPR